MNLDDMVRRFILGENKETPSTMSYIQALSTIISEIRPTSLREKRNLEIANQHIREIKRNVRKLNETIASLEEQVRILEEGKNND